MVQCHRFFGFGKGKNIMTELNEEDIERKLKAVKLFADCTAKPYPHRLYPFPKPNGSDMEDYQIAMVALTKMDETRLQYRAMDIVKRELEKIGFKPTHKEVWETPQCQEQFTVLCIYTFCRRPDNLEEKFFAKPEHVSEKCTSDQLSMLFYYYLQTQKDLACAGGTITDEAMAEYMKLLEEGASADFLLQFSPLNLTRFVTYLVANLSARQNPTNTSILP